MKLTIAGDSAANQPFARDPPVGTANVPLPSHSAHARGTDDTRTMRVLHIGKFYLPYRGGIESHLHALCRELTKSITVNVIVANETPRLMTSEINEVKIRRLPRLFNLSATPVCPTMPREIRRAAADIIHLHLPNPFAALAYLASGHAGRLVITWHSDIVRQKAVARMLGPLDDCLLRRASAIIATSPNYVDSSPILSRNRERCRVIPFGIDADALRPRDAELAGKIRQRYGARIILAVGRMVYYKGFEYLIRAMASVRGHLLLVGEGRLQAKLERVAFDAGARDRITFLGRVSQEEVLGYYNAADVFVMPSIARSEAFGIAQLEAMACGKPVINTRLRSGVPFVSPDGVTGTTVEPANSSELAAAINRLLDDPGLRDRYGAAAARRAREEFSIPTMVDRTLELYREVIANGRVLDGGVRTRPESFEA
jgi:glycosyltransferase involved in cell wall biosynthesis